MVPEIPSCRIRTGKDLWGMFPPAPPSQLISDIGSSSTGSSSGSVSRSAGDISGSFMEPVQLTPKSVSDSGSGSGSGSGSRSADAKSGSFIEPAQLIPKSVSDSGSGYRSADAISGSFKPDTLPHRLARISQTSWVWGARNINTGLNPSIINRYLVNFTNGKMEKKEFTLNTDNQIINIRTLTPFEHL